MYKRQRFIRPKESKTNADRIVGFRAIVLEEIDNLHGTGSIEVEGKIDVYKRQELADVNGIIIFSKNVIYIFTENYCKIKTKTIDLECTLELRI